MRIRAVIIMLSLAFLVTAIPLYGKEEPPEAEEAEDYLIERIRQLEEEVVSLRELISKFVEEGQEPVDEAELMHTEQINNILDDIVGLSYVIDFEILENAAYDDYRDLISELISKKSDPKSIILAEILIMDIALENDLIMGEGDITSARGRMDTLCFRIKTLQANKYTDEERRKIESTRRAFNNLSNEKMPLSETEVVFVNAPVQINVAVLMFNGNIVAPAESLCKLVGADFIEMTFNRNFAIQSDKILVECVAGQNVIFVNDKLKLLNVPIFEFEGKMYLSVTAFCDAFEIDYMHVAQDLIILYGGYDKYKPLDYKVKYNG